VALIALSLVGWGLARAWAGTAALPPRRRATLTGLRLAVLAALLLVLMRPVSVGPRAPSRDARVAVLVDASGSMELADAGGRTRRAAARSLVEEQILPAVAGMGSAEVSSFGGPHQPATPGEALRDAARVAGGAPLAGVIVVSDGAFDPGPRPDPAGPVFTVGVGSAGDGVDREVVDATLGDPTISDSNVPLMVTLASRGTGPRTFEVRLRDEDGVLDVRTLAPPAGGGVLRSVFRVSPRRDRPTVYTVEIPAIPGELTPANNAVHVLAPPPGRPRRVLMIEGAPGFEHSFLKRPWLSDPGLRVDAVVRKGQNDRGEATFYVQAPAADLDELASGFPSSLAALFAYDAVVLANAAPDELSAAQLEMLRRFVAHRGGGLLAFGARVFEPRGLAGTRLEPMLPVGLPGDGADLVVRTAARTGSGGLAATPDGLEHPVMQLGGGDPARLWSELPALASIARMGGPRPGAAILAVGEAPGGGVRPLVAVQRYGNGRVLAFLGEASWRWKMQLPASDARHETFWRQALRWVAAGAPGSVSLEPADLSDPSRLTIVVRDEQFAPTAEARVLVTAVPLRPAEGIAIVPPGGAEQVATLRDAAGGVFEARVPLPAGTPVRIEAVAQRADREIGRGELWLLGGGIDREMADPRRNDLALSRFAEAGGGRLLAPADLADLPRILAAAGRTPGAGDQQQGGLEERDLWHHPAVFLAIVSALAVEWALRRRWGLS
jgi:uncharacterized membrane protein